MKKLSERELINLIREEWNRKISSLAENSGVDLMFNAKTKDGEKKSILSTGLKIKNKETGELYTVKEVGITDATIVSPQGERVHVTKDDLEKNYELG